MLHPRGHGRGLGFGVQIETGGRDLGFSGSSVDLRVGSASRGLRVAVLGGGLLGVTTAILLARAGCRIELYDSGNQLFSGATAVNEGKVHLGAVYALGDEDTRWHMLRSALSFAPILEQAIGCAVDWERVSSSTFRHLVMPGSLAAPSELAQRYAVINELLPAAAAAVGSNRYLGRPLDIVIDTALRKDPRSGLPAFDTFERSVDPAALLTLLNGAISSLPVTVRTQARVDHLYETRQGLFVGCEGKQACDGPFDAAVNCTWQNRARLIAAAGHPVQRTWSYRIKQAVFLEPVTDAPNVTLVLGPFGDIVAHASYTYASWYPLGRLAHEHGIVPSAAFERLLKEPAAVGSGLGQLAPLQAMGLLPRNVRVRHVAAGAIIGDGVTDIDNPDSGLHSRHGDRALQHGRLFTPLNYKFSSAPWAALAVSKQLLATVH